MNLLDEDNPDYIKIRKILKAIVTTDNMVSDKFLIVNHTKLLKLNIKWDIKNETKIMEYIEEV